MELDITVCLFTLALSVFLIYCTKKWFEFRRLPPGKLFIVKIIKDSQVGLVGNKCFHSQSS